MSLQTETLLSFFDHLDNEKQSLFLKELTSRLDVSKLEELCSMLPEILKAKIILDISQLLKELGYDKDFEITKFLFFEANDPFDNSFILYVTSEGVNCRFEFSPFENESDGNHKDLNELITKHRSSIYEKVLDMVRPFNVKFSD